MSNTLKEEKPEEVINLDFPLEYQVFALAFQTPNAMDFFADQLPIDSITSNENDIHWDDVIEISGKILGVKPQFIHVSANVIQKIWPEIYDELAYNKNLSTILDDSKIKKISDITAEIDISRGIENTIDAMEIEYNKNGLELDDWWNDHCNAVIYYAYANDYLEKIEKDIVSSYIAEYGIDQFKNSFIRVKRYNKIQLVKGKLKIILKRIK